MKIDFSCDINTRNILRWLLGLVLVWAALGKLANLQEFFATLVAYRLPLPDALLRFTGVILPWLELLCGLQLFSGFRLDVALLWTVVLLLIFAVCAGQAWLRGLPIACGCLDLRLAGIPPGSKMAALLESVGFAFLRALALLGASLYLMRTQPAQSLSEQKIVPS
jgi:putative oxidoreductase